MNEVVFVKWLAGNNGKRRKTIEAGVRRVLLDLFSNTSFRKPIEVTALKTKECSCLLRGVRLLPREDTNTRGFGKRIQLYVSTGEGTQVLRCKIAVPGIRSWKFVTDGTETVEELRQLQKNESLEEIIKRCQEES